MGSERNEDNEDQTRVVMSAAPGVLECADMSALSNATGSASRKSGDISPHSKTEPFVSLACSRKLSELSSV